LLFTVTFHLSAQKADSVKFISLEPYDFHLQYLKEDSALLIDVREFFEYKKSRIKDAVNIPSSGNLEFASDTLDKKLVLFLYCTTGFRSSRVCEKLSDKGFRKIINLEGGIVAWRKDGNPVERHKVRR
jgi:rhodanese-related sulfurtransferase